jgi:hypothetical protein
MGTQAQGSHDFTLQAVMDLKQSVGELKESVRGIQSSMQTIEQRLAKTGDKIEEGFSKFESKVGERLSKLEEKAAEVKSTLRATKWVLVVLFFIGGALLTGVGWVAKEIWDLSRPLIIEKLANTPAAPSKGAQAAPPTPAPAPPPSGKRS